MSLVRDWSSSACPVCRVATIAKGIYTTTPMFSPRPKDSIPTDGPARGATEGQPHGATEGQPHGDWAVLCVSWKAFGEQDSKICQTDLAELLVL